MLCLTSFILQLGWSISNALRQCNVANRILGKNRLWSFKGDPWLCGPGNGVRNRSSGHYQHGLVTGLVHVLIVFIGHLRSNLTNNREGGVHS
ncbi:hypothetical protein BDW71DRAFT_180921 [Aspergillus fruticulosus]